MTDASGRDQQSNVDIGIYRGDEWKMKDTHPTILKHYFGLKRSNGEVTELKIIHRTEEFRAVAMVSMGEWTEEIDADLSELAT